MTTPINFPASPPDDGDFSHPAFNGANANANANTVRPSEKPDNYNILGMAKDLYNEAGLEWPDWVEDPNTLDETNEGEINNGNSTDTTPPNTPPPDPNSTVVKIGDREIPIQQGEALLQWQDWLTANPDKAQTIIKFLRNEKSVPAPPTMVDLSQQQPTQPTQQQPTQPVIQPPAGLDLETPRDKFFFDQLNKLAESTTRLVAISDQQQQAIKQAEMAQRAREDTAYAINQFKSKHQLSDDEVESVRQIASDRKSVV